MPSTSTVPPSPAPVPSIPDGLADSDGPGVLVVDASPFADGPNGPSLSRMLAALQDLEGDWGGTVAAVVDSRLFHRLPRTDQRRWDRLIAEARFVCPPAGTVGGLGRFLAAVAEHAGAVVATGRHISSLDGLRQIRPVTTGGRWTIA